MKWSCNVYLTAPDRMGRYLTAFGQVRGFQAI